MCGSGSIPSGSPGGRSRGGPAYTASKGGITVLVRSLANAWGEYGIRVNAVNPGVTETAMTADYSDDAQAAAAYCAVRDCRKSRRNGPSGCCRTRQASSPAKQFTSMAGSISADPRPARPGPAPPRPGSRRQGFRAPIAWAKFTLSKLRDARLGDSRS